MNDLELTSTDELVDELGERFEKVVVICAAKSEGEGEQPPPLSVRFATEDAEEVLALAMKNMEEGKGKVTERDIDYARRLIMAEMMVVACRSVLDPENDVEETDDE